MKLWCKLCKKINLSKIRPFWSTFPFPLKRPGFKKHVNDSKWVRRIFLACYSDIQGVSQLVSQVIHPLFLLYMHESLYPYVFKDKGLRFYFFEIFFSKFLFWSWSGPGTGSACFTGSGRFAASSLQVFNPLALKPLHMVTDLKISFFRSDLRHDKVQSEVGVQAKKLNTSREHEFAVNQAEPENQAEPAPGPDHDQNKNFNFFFEKIKPKTFVFEHVKGYLDFLHVLEKLGVYHLWH